VLVPDGVYAKKSLVPATPPVAAPYVCVLTVVEVTPATPDALMAAEIA